MRPEFFTVYVSDTEKDHPISIRCGNAARRCLATLGYREAHWLDRWGWTGGAGRVGKAEMSDVHVAPLRAFLSERPAIWRLAAVVGGSWVIAASSWVSAPMYPVPMTLQTFAILLVAGLAGARLGVAIVITWLAQAALGLPFLAEGSGGLDPFAGPTAGYLAGFVIAVIVSGALSERPGLRGWLPMLGVFMLGHAVILGCGWSWLAVKIGPQAAFDSGVSPFLIGSVLKSFLAVAVIRLVEPWIRSLSR